MIQVWIIGAEGVIAKLGQVPETVAGALRAAVSRQAFELQGYIKDSKLSGQVLRNRRDRLRGDINVELGDDGLEASVGADVVYARIHEYGFHGSETVKAHQRLITKAFGRDLKYPVAVSVRSFSRTMNMPERSFLRSALREKADSIKAALERAVAEGLKS